MIPGPMPVRGSTGGQGGPRGTSTGGGGMRPPMGRGDYSEYCISIY